MPAAVSGAIGAIYGLHGIPLKRRKPTVSKTANANVTPAVIASTYNVKGVTIDRKTANRQAVAEFQGQTMNASDLATYFKRFVPEAKAGDDVVSKYHADPGNSHSAAEASLDIQFIMGLTPGIKTDFYLYNSMDFCADLKNWTGHLLTDPDCPLVHSVSYGLQANLSSSGCTMAELEGVDGDFAKLAAKGVSIIFASGDSGSGYTPDFCTADLQTDKALTGTVAAMPVCPSRGTPAPCPAETVDAASCCQSSFEAELPGFTFTPPADPTPAPDCSKSTKALALIGTIVSASASDKADPAQCCGFAAKLGVGYTFFSGALPPYHTCPDGNHCCLVFSALQGNYTNATSAAAGAMSGTNEKKKPGACAYYSKVSGTSAKKGVTSGGDHFENKPTLFASWPSTSAWVTSVGATRFQGQKVGNAEMASDQFGSGGGFSSMIKQAPDATWQAADVAAYLKSPVSKGAKFPPANSFDAAGRANPDVSALGEGFQIVMTGKVLGIGGTSASTPLFSGLVSLLNEARLQKGGKPMGFLNPWIYKNAAAFKDVTVGTNAISRSGTGVRYGWNATTGWDAATGLGTPLFDKMLKAALRGL